MMDDEKIIILTDKNDIKDFIFMVVINQGYINRLVIQFVDKHYPIFKRIDPLLNDIGWEEVTLKSEERVIITKEEYKFESNQRVYRKIGALRK